MSVASVGCYLRRKIDSAIRRSRLVKPEAKKILIREWMVAFGSFWAACLLAILTGLWIPHLPGMGLGDREIVIIILWAWLAIYLAYFAVLPILKLRRKQ